MSRATRGVKKRFAPVTMTSRPVKSTCPSCWGIPGLPGLHVDEHLHGPARFKVVQSGSDLGERHDARDEVSGWHHARADELDRRVEVRSVVDAGTDDRKLS